MKKYSLISTIFNEEKSIIRFLESYQKQTQKANEYIIVDGGSTDNTIKLVTEFAETNPELNIKLIVDKSCSKKFTKGPIAKGRNIAIQNSKYDYIVATDAGCVLPEDWFENIIYPFEVDNSIEVVSGWCEGLKGNDYQNFFALFCMPSIDSVDTKKFLPSSRNIAFTKNAWQKAGKYPEQTYTAEDTLFDLNMKKAGCKFYFNKKAIVYWDLPQNIKEGYHKLYTYGFGEGQYKMFQSRYVLRALCILCPIKFIKLFFYNPKYFFWKYISLIANVHGFIIGLTNRVNK